MRVNWWFAGATFFLFAVGMAFLAGRASVKREAYQLVLDNLKMMEMTRVGNAGVNVIRGTSTLKLLERGDVAQALTVNCRHTATSLRSLRADTATAPDGVAPVSAERIARQAEEVLARLRKSGACSPLGELPAGTQRR